MTVVPRSLGAYLKAIFKAVVTSASVGETSALLVGGQGETKRGEQVGSAKSRPSQRILVIDDNRDAADSLVMLLELYGSIAHPTYSAAAGIEALRELKFDIVFIDLGMPVVDGFETARRIRALPAGNSVKLIALTAWSKEQVEERARNVGFDGHLTKPAPFEALCNLLWCEHDCVKERQTCIFVSGQGRDASSGLDAKKGRP